MSTTWTLFVDESGRFEDALVPGETRERVGRVVGGVLCPLDARRARLDWESKARELASTLQVSYPWHACEMEPDAKGRLFAEVSKLLSAHGATWIAVGDDRRIDDEAGLLLNYVRMLGALVDLAMRVVAAHGGQSLQVLCAQRTVPVLLEHASKARAAGLAVKNLDGAAHLQPVVELEIRAASDAVRREQIGALPPWPILEGVQRAVAADADAHPGIALADLGAHAARAALRRSDGSFAASAFACPLASLAEIRRLDRALRARPTELVRAAKILASLESPISAGGPESAPWSTGPLLVGRLLWASAEARLAASDLLGPAVVTLAAQAEAELTVKSGVYGGVWRALETAWAGDTELARAARAAMSRQREFAARLWRLTMQCANHLGDVENAERAADSGEALAAGGPSLRLLAETFHLRTLRTVALQNRLPCSPEEALELMGRLRRSSRLLEEGARGASRVLEAQTGSDGAIPPRPDSAEERALWRHLLDSAPSWHRPDRDQGAAYGTAARSLAFCGDIDDAITLQMIARALLESDRDLRFNALVLLRMECERGRLGPGARPSVLDACLKLGAVGALGPKDAAAAVRADPGLRFALDGVLRALLWGRPSGTPEAKWLPALNKRGETSLYAVISEIGDHPSELLARHAGELVRRHGHDKSAAEWFEVSLAHSRRARDGTIQRFTPFTERLSADPSFVSEGPPGSLLNPTFEYR